MGEEKMTAKAPVQAAVTILVLCMGIGYEIWLLQQIDWSNPESIILMIILSAVMIITIWYILCLVFETSKKLIMDKEGCTVSVWGHKKTYKWEELCVKQIVYNTSIFSRNSYDTQYIEGVIFSPQPVKRKNSAYITSYERTRYWKTLFYVNFVLEGKKKQPYMGLYEVEKEEFFSKMQEWGVELEDMREKK